MRQVLGIYYGLLMLGLLFIVFDINITYTIDLVANIIVWCMNLLVNYALFIGLGLFLLYVVADTLSKK